MASEKYGPFRGGEIETGEKAKCPCGAGNKHTLTTAGPCDFSRSLAKQAAVAKNQGKAA